MMGRTVNVIGLALGLFCAGCVDTVPSDVLTRRQAVHAAARANDADVMKVVHSQRGGVAQVAPPTPANASLAPRQVVQAVLTGFESQGSAPRAHCS